MSSALLSLPSEKSNHIQLDYCFGGTVVEAALKCHPLQHFVLLRGSNVEPILEAMLPPTSVGARSNAAILEIATVLI